MMSSAPAKTAAAGTAPARRRRFTIDAEARRTARWFVTPALGLMAIVALLPISYAVWLSLHQYSVRTPGLSRFVGFQNYVTALTSDSWWQAVGQTFIIAIISVALEVVLGVMMALLLNLAFRGRAVLRSVLLMPYAVLTVVSAITWKNMFDPHLGLVTNVLQALGLPGGDVIWLAQPGYAVAVVILAEVWKTTPFAALLILAGLQVIPSEVYEAASVDGATKTQQFFQITLPLLRPAILLAGMLRLLDALRIFDLPFVLTGGTNGTATMTFVSYVALREERLIGEGSALSLLTFFFVMVVALVYLRFAGGNLRAAATGAK